MVAYRIEDCVGIETGSLADRIKVEGQQVIEPFVPGCAFGKPDEPGEFVARVGFRQSVISSDMRCLVHPSLTVN